MIIVLRAVSGACKGTITNLLSNPEPGLRPHSDLSGTALWAELGLLKTRLAGRTIFAHAADDYFTSPEGVYNFDPQHLSAAHGQCYRRTIEDVYKAYLKPTEYATIVHNTNCSIAEVAPYCQLASAYVQELHVLTVLVDPLVAWRRNEHGTPLTHVIKQDLVLRQSILEWPAWWPQKVFAL